jgi:hypothetical protein
MGRARLSGSDLGRLFAAGRVLVGAAVLARPEVLARGLRIDAGTARRTAWLARMFGARDLAIGAGTLYALSRDAAPGPWLVASAVSDATDAAVLTGAIRRRQVSAPPAALGAALGIVSVGVQAGAGWALRAGAVSRE